MQNKLLYISILALIILTRCGRKEVTDYRTYLKCLANKDYGLVKEKSVAGISYKLKHLPSEYVMYTSDFDITQKSKQLKDSLKKIHSNSVTFLLNIGLENSKIKTDITRIDVSSYSEFANRIEKMAFKAQEWIKLKVRDKEFSPSIVRLETLNSVETSRNFLVVFNAEKNTPYELLKNDICFIYEDELFETGVNKFLFNKSDFENFPLFVF